MRTGEEFDLGPVRWESIVSRHRKAGLRFITGVSYRYIKFFKEYADQ